MKTGFEELDVVFLACIYCVLIVEVLSLGEHALIRFYGWRIS